MGKEYSRELAHSVYVYIYIYNRKNFFLYQLQNLFLIFISPSPTGADPAILKGGGDPGEERK